MAKPEWGEKRICQSCDAPFYDLGRKNIECPKCRTPFDLMPPAKKKRRAPAAKPKEAIAEGAEFLPENPEAAAAVIDGYAETGIKAGIGPTGDVNDKGKDEPVDDEEKEEKSDELIEDVSDLGQDYDDMSEVKEHIDDGVGDKN